MKIDIASTILKHVFQISREIRLFSFILQLSNKSQKTFKVRDILRRVSRPINVNFKFLFAFQKFLTPYILQFENPKFLNIV